MRDAATVLAIIHERGRQGLPLEDIYRQLYNPSLYIRAYERLRRNHGGRPRPGAGETVGPVEHLQKRNQAASLYGEVDAATAHALVECARAEHRRVESAADGKQVVANDLGFQTPPRPSPP